ncbi:MAG: DUF3536 domain-containing protein [Deltaproteobacteria bacterium]|nr:DUF3536 domain-containing protein [Deltaproteobacteria bacterium]
MTDRRVCIHGHFYQPPRDNPWLEAVELQDSAAPYHDWNARITAECYHPNATSRVLSESGRVAEIVNNYQKTSFNFGPTLLAWLADNAPETYEGILAADRDGAERFGGHGPAIAQAYNHLILPLATPQDRRTQVRWGIADFVHRFHRSPEGMWLPETAVDLDTLEALAEHQIDFTILAPHQALAVRPLDGSEDWADVSGARIDTTRPYRVELPSGRHIAVFFYDGETSTAVAFEGLLERGEHLAERLVAPPADDGPRLFHIATDGETYGHHHRRGDMALAFAERWLEERGLARLTVYGEFLAEVPPTHEVRIAEQTSWSCAHGVERWRSDCGCSGGHGQGWNQAWRGPLRGALDGLRDAVNARFEEAAAPLFTAPWEARDAYIDVILDRSPESLARFLAAQCQRELSDEERVAALELMEMQRHAQLMYTSCGWFFDDVSGLETQQILGYASRVCQLAERRLGVDVEADFVAALAEARSNIEEQQDGRRVYERHVRPMRLDLRRVAGHDVVHALFDEQAAFGVPAPHQSFCYAIEHDEHEVNRVGEAAAVLGRLSVRSLITTEEQRFVYAAVRFGHHNVAAAVADEDGAPELPALREAMMPLFARAAWPELVQVLIERFGSELLTLQALFRDEQRRVLAEVLAGAVTEAEQRLAETFRDRLPLMHFAEHLGMPQPRVFRAAAEIVLGGQLSAALSRPEPHPDEVAGLVESARELRVPLDGDSLAYVLGEVLRGAADALGEDGDDLAPVERLGGLVALVETLPFQVSTRVAQDRWFAARDQHYASALRSAEAGDAAAAAWLDAFDALGDALHCVVPPRGDAEP